jgi:general secretion pathway protein A
MYQSFYHLNAKPFQITSDPKFLWMGEKHSEALATLKYGILENKGFLLLTGDIGTGKTALINQLVRMIDVAAIVATIPDPGLSPMDFFNFLAQEFEMDGKFASKGDFLIQLKQFLLSADSAHKRVLLIVDEAQRLNHELLEQIRLLSNIEMDNRKLINIFFVGQTEFNQTLLDERNKAVRQRISVNYHIEPLDTTETGKYVRHRLAVAGATRDIFTDDAIQAIHHFSSGYPRLINILCDHALLTGYSASLETIDVDTIKECERELRIPINKEKAGRREVGSAPLQAAGSADTIASASSPRARKLAIGVVFMLLLLFTSYLVYESQQSGGPQWKMEDIAPQTYEGLTGGDSVKLADQSGSGSANPSAGQPVGESPENAGNSQMAGVPEQPTAAQRGTEPPVETPPANPFSDQPLIIYFQHNSNEVTDEGFDLLNRVAEFMADQPRTRISVNGYTDSTGPRSYNLSVSQFRANAIKSYLVGKGVAADNIRAKGMGPDKPIASNRTAEGRERNRRVEIELDVGG